MEQVAIQEHPVGPDSPCYVIAEAGANHNRDLGMARALIEVAAEAGANAVKFQTYSAETLYSRKTPPFDYLESVSKADVFELIKSVELPRDWQQDLAEYSRDKHIAFLSTPFDLAAVDELDALAVPAFKVASFELVDLGLIRHVANKGRPVLLSTGMATYGEIEDAITACREVGNDQIVLLHCISLYPTPSGLVNLRAIPTMSAAFCRPVGLSDHTMGVVIPGAAVAMGARVIEKHFTLDRRLPGPDHPFALEPQELRTMIAGIREVEDGLRGDGVKAGPAPEEEQMFRLARRSIVLARDVPAGKILEPTDLTVKRPGFGIKPKMLPYVIGRRVTRALEADDILTWDMI
jgi:sialic acid synthase SpsE